MSRKTKDEKHLRRIVNWCIILLSFVVFFSAASAWHAGEQLAPATVAAILTAVVSELLMSLLIKKDKKNKKEKTEEKTEIPWDETI